MAGLLPNPVSIQTAFFGAITLSGTTAVIDVDNDLLATPFQLRRIFYRVSTAVTSGPAVVSVVWNPTAAADGTDVALGTFSVPTAADETWHEVNFMTSDGTTTVVGAGGSTSAYGIGGSTSYAGGSNNLCGPGGTIEMTPDGEADAGVIEVWIEVARSSQQLTTSQTITTSTDATVS